MAKNLSSSRLRKLLVTATKDQLVEEIVELAAKFDTVQKHFLLRLQPQDETRVFDEYKARVIKAMMPKSDFGEPKVKDARAIISEYRKVALSELKVTDLMLVYVECGVAFLNDLGDYKESFYDSLQSMFEATLKLIQKNELEQEFVKRCRVLVGKCEDMGYGFGDEMKYLYGQCFKGNSSE